VVCPTPDGGHNQERLHRQSKSKAQRKEPLRERDTRQRAWTNNHQIMIYRLVKGNDSKLDGGQGGTPGVLNTGTDVGVPVEMRDGGVGSGFVTSKGVGGSVKFL
jgi:hypothetical protein